MSLGAKHQNVILDGTLFHKILYPLCASVTELSLLLHRDSTWQWVGDVVGVLQTPLTQQGGKDSQAGPHCAAL